MNPMNTRLHALTFCLIIIRMLTFAETTDVVVNAQCNIYGAGHSVPPAGIVGGPGILPAQVPLDLSGVGAVEFDLVRGVVDFNLGGTIDNDGNQPSVFDRDTVAYGGVSGILSPTRSFFLTGIFLTDAEPVDPAPPRLEFYSYDFSILAPEIAQLFFIGDGRGPAGAKQRFIIPTGATRLFLGFVDNGDDKLPGWYNDNSGYFDVLLSTVSTTNLTEFSIDIHKAIAVSVETEPGVTYQFQRSFDLSSWIDLGSPVEGDGLAKYGFELFGGNTQRFYRAVGNTNN